MVELKTCGGLVNAGALCGIEDHEEVVKGENNNMNSFSIADLCAELRREREKNAKLVERISILEAQIQLRDHSQSFLTLHAQGSCLMATKRSLKKFKRQKTGVSPRGNEEIVSANGETAPKLKQDKQCVSKDANLNDHLVNWMCMDEALLLQVDKLKDDDFVAGCDDTDDSDEEEENGETGTNLDLQKGETYESTNYLDAHKCQAGGVKGTNPGSFFCGKSVREPSRNCCDFQICDKKGTGSVDCSNKTAVDHFKEMACQGLGNGSYVKKPPKIAFCPKEVKRMVESEILQLKNAQSHTIRKIIVFASLGIRHGCEEMYELDFNHFSILRKGEPYVSPKNPGEHVLYENPGVRRKIFYLNRQNPTLCPVQILEEEKAMRPSDPSCPSCLFLCIKYGGRTRNLPQNEYVRQRMGRNKLKSFGPVMCRMAMLVHIRSGSFFFKALGITLLFMAGFPDDQVQRETKYRSLDLLQKYYRTDEDAEGEELFLPQPFTNDTASPGSEKLSEKTTTTKSKGKKQPNSTNRPHGLPRSAVHHSVPSNSVPSNHFGLRGYPSVQTHSTAALRSLPSPHNPLAANQENNCSDANVSYNNQTTCLILPPQPGNAFMPMLYWPAPNAFHPSSYASMYGYPSFPSATNNISLQPQHYYRYHSSGSAAPKRAGKHGKNERTLEESDSTSGSSSSSLDTKAASPSCK